MRCAATARCSAARQAWKRSGGSSSACYTTRVRPRSTSPAPWVHAIPLEGLDRRTSRAPSSCRMLPVQRELAALKFIDELSAHLRDVREPHKALRHALRDTCDFFQAAQGCVAELR